MEAANACSISIIPPMVTNPFNRTCPAQRGFTLIELLVTLAVAAVLALSAAACTGIGGVGREPGAAGADAAGGPGTIKVIAYNDFHGYL